MGQITVLSLMRFSEDPLNKLRAVSPRLEVQQQTGAALAGKPLLNRVDRERSY